MAEQYIFESPMPGDRQIYEYQDGSWVLIDTQPASVPEHSHAEHGDINFTGKIAADGEEGLTGQRTLQGYTLKYKKGLLIGFQAP